MEYMKMYKRRKYNNNFIKLISLTIIV